MTNIGLSLNTGATVICLQWRLEKVSTAIESRLKSVIESPTDLHILCIIHHLKPCFGVHSSHLPVPMASFEKFFSFLFTYSKKGACLNYPIQFKVRG